MRKLLLLPLAVLLIASASAQNKTYRFHFNNRLSENVFQGSPLVPMCAGTYTFQTLAGVNKRAYNFDKGCGLVFNDSATNLLASGSYTIEMYFKLDTIQGYKKLIDFDSLGVDPGFYNQNGKLVMYNKFTSPDSVIGAGQYEYAAITRDGSTKDMYVYHNDKVIGMLNDNNDQYIYGTEKLLIFFKDDKGTNGEQTGGSVGLIHISNYVMDSTTIKSNYNGLASTLNISETANRDKQINVWPNPATDYVAISMPVAGSYILYDLAGRAHAAGKLKHGTNKLAIQQYPAGIYMLEVISGEGGSTVYKVVKQ
ncbi:MAG TPA: T9SS type A sorting domain-containing protein [Flavipsychrobacter sp.]